MKVYYAIAATILEKELDFQDDNGMLDKEFIKERFNLSNEGYKTLMQALKEMEYYK